MSGQRLASQVLVLVLVLVPEPGCATSRRAYFAPARTRAELVAAAPAAAAPIETRQFVPVEHVSQDLRIACQARTIEDEPAPGARAATLSVRIWISNYSARRLELRPGEFSVVDDAGRRFAPREARRDGEATLVVLATAPARSAVDVIFPLPDAYDPDAARSFRLLWGFRIDDREYRHETLFERGRARDLRDPFLSLAPGGM